MTRLTFTWSCKILFVVLLLPFCIQAQHIVNGQVSSAIDQSPVSGATVIVKGTKTGTSTSYDGKFSIKANEGQSLLISGIGIQPKEVTVGSGDFLEINVDHEQQKFK